MPLWDAKGSTYGSLLIRLGEGDYIGGDTFIFGPRASLFFLLLKHEAAAWTTYDGHGQLLGESVHAAGTACLRLTAVQLCGTELSKAGGGGPVGAAWFAGCWLQSPDW